MKFSRPVLHPCCVSAYLLANPVARDGADADCPLRATADPEEVLHAKGRATQQIMGKGKQMPENHRRPLASFFLPSHAVYVGLATVAAATWWFLYDAEGPQVTFYQLVSKGWPGSPLRSSER